MRKTLGKEMPTGNVKILLLKSQGKPFNCPTSGEFVHRDATSSATKDNYFLRFQVQSLYC
jgi:hypothetical protein